MANYEFSRREFTRIELLVKKPEAELQIEHQYNQALESQIRALTESAKPNSASKICRAL